MKYVINETNEINNKEISDDVFQAVEYDIREREDLIDNLIGWIAEGNECKEMMKDDLKYLMSITDKYIISSLSTNEYLTENEKEGQAVLSEIYKMKIN